MAIYDKYYKQDDYFGKPYAEMMRFFERYPRRGSLVDLGAGQGRDAIPLAQIGYNVTAVDIAKTGLHQIEEKEPRIEIILSDIYQFMINEYDFILLDSMVHFYKNDIVKESELIQRILKEMKTNAVFINCLLKSEKAEKTLFNVINSTNLSFKEIENTYIDYPEANCQYHFLVIEKL